jgi:hypothetical protein
MDLDSAVEKVLRYVKRCLEEDGLGLFAVFVKDDGNLRTLFPEIDADLAFVYPEVEEEISISQKKIGIYVSSLDVTDMASMNAIALLCWDRGEKLTKIFPYTLEHNKVKFLDGIRYDGHDPQTIVK